MKMPISYSRLSTFENCPKQFEYQYILQATQHTDTVATLYGTRIHEALEHYGRDEKPLCAESAKFKPVVDKILALPGDKYFEHEMAVTEGFTPCGWDDEGTWARGIADLLVVNGDSAFCGDWKTGKVRDNPTQLKLFACFVFSHFPEVTTVKTAFIWLVHDEITAAIYKREHIDDLWASIKPRFDYLLETVDLGVYKAKPSGLCPWCAAKDMCPDKRRR